MSNYYTYTVKIAEEDIAEFLTSFYDLWARKPTISIVGESQESLNGILQDHFSDFIVINKDTVVGEFD